MAGTGERSGPPVWAHPETAPSAGALVAAFADYAASSATPSSPT